MRRLSILLCFILLAIETFSQSDRCHRYIPYFRSLNAEKLAKRITRKINNDSLKVAAIHCWMTHHIRYDVKKYLAFDHSVVPVKKILRKRKAICTGYSDLFNALCKSAGVQSTGVPGYTKNSTVDLNDKFYLEDHIWNAVYFNNNWHLVDLTWDAGYIKYFKRTFAGYFVYTFTLGHHDIQKYKPHFVFNPNQDYYLRSGLFFSTDHIPTNPVWQMQDPQRSITEAEKDSAYYFRNYRDTFPKPSTDGLNEERLAIAEAEERDREITEGFSAYNHNPKNNYGISISHYLLAMDEYTVMELKSTDTLTLLRQCDTVIARAQRSVYHAERNAHFLAIQKTDLKANNEKKLGIMKVQNGRLIASTRNVLKHLKTGKTIGKKGRKVSRSIIKNNSQRLSRLRKSMRFVRTKAASKLSAQDSIFHTRILDSLQHLHSQLISKIDSQFRCLDSLYSRLSAQFNLYAGASAANQYTGEGLCVLRTFSEDDLDYILRGVKDTLLDHKFEEDSLLIDSITGFIAKTYYKTFSQLRKDFNQFYKCHRSVAGTLCKLKKSCYRQNWIAKAHLQNKMEYNEELFAYRKNLSVESRRFNHIAGLCKGQYHTTKKELMAYREEKKIESALYTVRSSFINRQYASLMSMGNAQKIKSQRLLQKVNMQKNRLLKGKKV